MAWVKLDDHFFRNPKVVAAGRDARDLYLAGLCYCGAGLTDGVIPVGALRMLGADADIEDPQAGAAALVREGLWEQRADGNFRVHDYLDYNPTKERVLQTREVRSEAGSRGGKQRASNLPSNEHGPSLAFATENLQAKSNPVPSRPNPVPVKSPAEKENDAPAALAPPKISRVFLSFWAAWNQPPSKGHGARQESYEAWKRLGLDRPGADEARAAVHEGLVRWQACGRWLDGYVRDCQRWLKGRMWEDEPPSDPPSQARTEHSSAGVAPTPEEQAALDAKRKAALARDEPAEERWKRKYGGKTLKPLR